MTWTVNTLNTNFDFNALTYANGQFVGLTARYDNAAQRNRNYFVRSSNATDWIVQDMGVEPPFPLYEIGFGNGVFVAHGTGYDGNDYRTFMVSSSNGIHWTRAEIATEGAPVSQLVFADGEFLGTVGNGRILTSPDGYQWSLSPDRPALGGLRLRYLNGNFVSPSGSSVAVSTNGARWSYYETGIQRLSSMLLTATISLSPSAN